MTEIAMPRLSDSMQEGTILSWLKDDGDEVAVGDELVEIETDKATMTYESPAEGTLRIVAAVGETLPVGAPIARLGEAAEDVRRAERAAGRAPSTPRRGPGSPREHQNENENGSRSRPCGRRRWPAAWPPSTGSTSRRWRDRAARADHPGRRGRQRRHRERPGSGAGPVFRRRIPGSRALATVQELTRVQKLIARRMAEAKATIPHFQVQTEADIGALLALRAQLKDQPAPPDPLPSLNDFIVKACALALRRHPRANGSYRDGRFELHEQVNVGIAVAAADALVVPTIVDADSRSLGAIAGEARRLAAAVRDGSVTPRELSGATFTVSNLGMYGMTAITPVINPPQAAILGVGAARAVLALDDGGAVTERQLMTLTLSCDHRILYGADAAEFLADIRRGLESALALLL